MYAQINRVVRCTFHAETKKREELMQKQENFEQALAKGMQENVHIIE